MIQKQPPTKERQRMTEQEYRSRPELSFSDLKLFSESHWKYHLQQISKLPRLSTPELETGRIVHAFVLEGRQEWIEQPATYQSKDGEKPWNNNATVCKKWVQNHRSDTILSASEAGRIREMREALLQHRHAQPLLAAATEFELPLFAADQRLPHGRKSRLDMYGKLNGRGFIADLKTTNDASYESCVWTMRRYGYHRQAAFYLEVAAANGMDVSGGFYLIFIEKSTPPQINVRRVADAAVGFGSDENRRDIERLIECQKSGLWPDYSGTQPEPDLIDLPEWVYTRKLNEMAAALASEL